MLPLLARDFHVYVLDVPGHGRSAHDPARYDATTNWGADTAAVIADAFHRMSWQRDFDQAVTLRSVWAPSILVHADWRITDTGILQGAMTDDDAARACTLMADCSLERVHTGHGFHVEAPDRFVELVHRLRDEVHGDRQTAGGVP